MTIFILRTALFFSLSLSALTEAAQNQLPNLMSPAEAINSISSEPLIYVGHFYPSNSISKKIPSCIFRNSKVTVKYTYCRKNEAPAFGLTVYSNDVSRGHIRFYAEGDGRPVSELKRSDYLKYLWRFYARENAPGYQNNLTSAEFSKYYDEEIYFYKLGCQIWEVSHDPNLQAYCTEEYKDQSGQWLTNGLKYWNKPPSSWYKMQKKFRKQIQGLTDIP